MTLLDQHSAHQVDYTPELLPDAYDPTAGQVASSRELASEQVRSTVSAPIIDCPLTVVQGMDGLLERAGTDLGVSPWVTVEQRHVSSFGELTGDLQWIHVDPERAKTGPFGGTVQHGFFTLGLSAGLLDQVFTVQGVGLVLNYGLNRVRFPAPLRVGSRVRMHVGLAEVKHLERCIEVVYHLVYEVEGQGKPCCVADLVFRYYA